MLYLAEVKKQNRNFLGSFKTELKLLACQHSDQTWSALPNEETLTSEEMETASEGTLWVLQLASNRQLQGKPELAAPELVRQLQKLSRLSEKLKDQQDEIERWKQSLTYQSQELARREMEIEARESETEEKEVELAQIERRKYEVEQARRSLESERQTLQELEQKYGSLLNASPEAAAELQNLLHRFSSNPDFFPVLYQALAIAQKSNQQQQQNFDAFWQELDQYRQKLSKQEGALHQRRELLALRQQELLTARADLEQAKTQLLLEQTTLTHQQEILGRLKAEIQEVESLQAMLYRLATGGIESNETKVDLSHLEHIPLGELEEQVQQLQADLERIVRFVNDQEEELTLQCQAVDELQVKMAQIDDYDRLQLEEELSEEQERKRMLDETLVGQRRNLKDRQDVLVEHRRILRRRQGIVDIENALPNINLDPVIAQLEARKTKLMEERNNLETDIQLRQKSLGGIQEMAQHLDQDQAQKRQSLEQEEVALHQLEQEVVQIQAQIQLYERTLQPLQDQLDRLKSPIESLGSLFDRRHSH